MGPMSLGLVQQLKLRRLMGLDEEEIPRDDEARLDELDASQETGDMFRDPASLEAYKSHIAQVPTRENFQPSTKERTMAGIGAMFTDPRDQGKYIKERLDRPYTEATEQYERIGEGLKNTVGAEESSLNRQRLGAQYESGLEERRIGREERSEDRDLDRQQKIEDTKQKYAMMAEQATSKIEAARILQEGKMEIAQMMADSRRDVASIAASNRPEKPEKTISAYNEETNENEFVSESEAKQRNMQKALSGPDTQKERFLRDIDTRFSRALELARELKGSTGQVQGRIAKGMNWAGLSGPKTQELQNVLESLRGDKLREQGGAALTATELKVYDNILTAITQGDDKLATNLIQGMSRTRGLMRRRKHPPIPGDPSSQSAPTTDDDPAGLFQ